MQPRPPSDRTPTTRRLGAAVALVLASAAGALPAHAQDDDEPPPAPVVLKHLPPRFSWEVALAPSYGMITQFPDNPPWMGLGVRAAWGRHWGTSHRLAGGLSVSFEGPITVRWSNNFEPHVLYDFVATEKAKGLWFGASLGPSLIVNTALARTSGYDVSFDAAPMVSARLGYSSPFSRIARRFFVGVEPKLRVIDGAPNGIVAIVIGSGMGY